MATSARRGGSIILMYHRISTALPDPFSLNVSPTHFSEHLDVLRRCHKPSHLRDVVHQLCHGRLDSSQVVITFDDGYLDNYTEAIPLMTKYGIPGTFFVPTGIFGVSREFMWDELEQILLGFGTLPRCLKLAIGTDVFEFDLGDDSVYLSENVDRHRHWTVDSGTLPTRRHALFRDLHWRLRVESFAVRTSVVDQLRQLSDQDTKVRSTHGCISAKELIAASANVLVEIGSHTITHPLLSSLPADEQRREICESKATLHSILGRRIASFAYPFGGKTDYTPTTTSLVREAGYAFACSTLDGTVHPDSDPYQLPRLQVPDADGDEFLRCLQEWS